MPNKNKHIGFHLQVDFAQRGRGIMQLLSLLLSLCSRAVLSFFARGKNVTFSVDMFLSE